MLNSLQVLLRELWASVPHMLSPSRYKRLALQLTTLTSSRYYKFALLSCNFFIVLQINEAFASMYVYCVRKLGIDPEKVNVNGGAIAIGHPLDESSSLSFSALI